MSFSLQTILSTITRIIRHYYIIAILIISGLLIVGFGWFFLLCVIRKKYIVKVKKIQNNTTQAIEDAKPQKPIEMVIESNAHNAKRNNENIRRRNRRQILNNNAKSLIYSKAWNPKSIYEPSNDDFKTYNHNNDNGFLWALIDEVINNGFQIDLCLYPKYTHEDEDDLDADDACHHNVMQNLVSNQDMTLLKIVNEKCKIVSESINRAQILALLLYTGCGCNYDMCASHRARNFKKWKWFDKCLYEAIQILNTSQSQSEWNTIYSGIEDVKLDSNRVSGGYFQTFTSTSLNREVAIEFMGDSGVLLKLSTKDWTCCSVKDFTKFKEEKEVLIARSTTNDNPFEGDVTKTDVYQTVTIARDGSCSSLVSCIRNWIKWKWQYLAIVCLGGPVFCVLMVIGSILLFADYWEYFIITLIVVFGCICAQLVVYCKCYANVLSFSDLIWGY